MTTDVVPGGAEELVRSNMPLVGYLVSELMVRLPPHLSRDDLTSAGLEALVKASRSYDAGRGVPFAKFAGLRIRGALLDELRGQDWASRSVRSKARRHSDAVEKLTAALHRTPTDAEVAGYLGIPVAELDAAANDVRQAGLLSLHGFADPDALDALVPQHEHTPEQELVNRERMAYLGHAVAALPERLRTVVVGYFLEERPMTEIAKELGISESRVSQMRSEALAQLKDGMNAHLDPDQVPASERPGQCVDRRRTAYFAAIAAAGDYRSRLAATQRTGTAAAAAAGTRATA